MDERLSRDVHGEYHKPQPYDAAMSGGSGAGLLVAIMVIGAIVLALYFLGSGGPSSVEGSAAPQVEPTAPAAQTDTSTGATAAGASGN